MFVPMLVGAAVSGAASALSLVHHYRHALGPIRWREVKALRTLPTTRIADAVGKGLVRIEGTVSSAHPQSGYHDRVACAFLELRHYAMVREAGRVQRMLVRVDGEPTQFLVDDGSGLLVIDPAEVRIDAEVLGRGLDNAVEEHRLRVGERVAVLGCVERVRTPLGAAMREVPTTIGAGHRLVQDGLVTWRSEPEVRPNLALPGGGTALSISALALGVLGVVLEGP